MSGAREAGAADAWPRLQAQPGVATLPFPAPVQRAERIGLHVSQRRFYRLTFAGAGHPSLVVVLHDRDDPEAVARYRSTAAWFEAAGVRVPRVFGATVRALLVEDGGDRLLADVPGHEPSLPELYEDAVRVIGRLQAHGLAVPPPNPHLLLDEERLHDELGFAERHAVRGWLGAPASARRERGYATLAAAVGRQPVRLCHRDYHSRNLLVADGLMVVDFQDAMVGPLFYDLVSLLRDNYRDLPEAAAERALRAWPHDDDEPGAVDAAAAVPSTPADWPPPARQGLALTAAQRSLKALGTFGYQVSVAGRPEFAAYARRTWRHARAALAALGWAELIEQLDVFERL